MTASRIPGRRTLWQIFRWPLALAVTSAVGLVSALVGDGAYDALSWLMLALPCAVVAAALWASGRRGRAQGRA